MFKSTEDFTVKEMLILIDAQYPTWIHKEETRKALITGLVNSMVERGKLAKELAKSVFQWHDIDPRIKRYPADIH